MSKLNRGGDGLVNTHPGQRFDLFTGSLLPPPRPSNPPALSHTAGVSQTKLRATVPEIQSLPSACTTHSYNALQSRVFKHERVKEESEQRYKVPVTETQKLMWDAPTRYNATAPTHGRIACAETKVAEAQILGARHV